MAKIQWTLEDTVDGGGNSDISVKREILEHPVEGEMVSAAALVSMAFSYLVDNPSMIHNILQVIATERQELTEEQKKVLEEARGTEAKEDTE